MILTYILSFFWTEKNVSQLPPPPPPFFCLSLFFIHRQYDIERSKSAKAVLLFRRSRPLCCRRKRESVKIEKFEKRGVVSQDARSEEEEEEEDVLWTFWWVGGGN